MAGLGERLGELVERAGLEVPAHVVRGRAGAELVERGALVALGRRVIDLEHATPGELGQAQRAAVEAGAEEHELVAAAGDARLDERPHGVVEQPGADLHVRDPLPEPGELCDRGGAALVEQLLDARAS